MKERYDRSSPALRMIAALLTVIAITYFLVPFPALKADRMLASHPHWTGLWLMLGLHPVTGIAMVYISGLVWFRYTPRLVPWIWLAFIVAGLASPVTMMLVLHYGK